MANGFVAPTLPGMGAYPTTTANSTSTVAQPSHAELTSKLAGQDLTGICGCGTCTVHTYLLNGCQHSSQIPALSLPFVDLSYLKGNQRQIVLGRLYLEYQYLLSKFCRLKREIFRTIMSKKLTFYYLSNTVVKFDSFMPSVPPDDKMAEVRKAKTVPQLYSMFPEDASFLEYHIFKDLAEDLKVERNVDSMRAYEQELDQFSQRSIFECPLFSQAGKDGHSNFILEMSQDRCSLNIHELVCIQEQICSALGVLSNTVCLCNVSKLQTGSIQVIFRIPNFVKDGLLPLSRERQTKLRQLGFLSWSFYSGLDISYNPAQLANQLLSSGRQNDTNHNSERSYTNSADLQRMDDLSSDDDDKDESPSMKKLKPAPGKKTRGRVKIPMEYIKNKLRRYTTFSKRKSNIMKKAYELSTLTGTQVMLMVASETGHVYTFATPKLQPMITSDAGKALIQTCLHQPDPVMQNSEGRDLHGSIRMCSSGYEETELGMYAPSEKEKHKQQQDLHPSSIISPTSSGHEMLSIYNPPPPSLPPSLANELLPSGILHSPLSTSNSTLLPPPLISPDGYSPGPVESDGEEILDSHSPVS